jgi:hypothetical protein
MPLSVDTLVSLVRLTVAREQHGGSYPRAQVPVR